MAPSAQQPESTESQTLLESFAPTHSQSAADDAANTPPSEGRSRGVVVAGLLVLAATAGVVGTNTARSVAMSSFASKTASSHVAGGHPLYEGLESITAHNEYSRTRGQYNSS